MQVLREQLARRAGPGGEALVPTLSRALADLQERLIYRCVSCVLRCSVCCRMACVQVLQMQCYLLLLLFLLLVQGKPYCGALWCWTSCQGRP